MTLLVTKTVTYGWLFFLSQFSVATLASQKVNAPLPWSQLADRSSCPDSNSYLWVEHATQQSCIRYFASQNLSGQKTVAIVLYGDRSKELNTLVQHIQFNTREAQEKRAANMERALGIPVVVLARPGTFGSSGDHRARKTMAELEPIYAAMNMLKSRYGVQRYVLIGHSGGGLVAAAMLTMGRDDIQCAVLVSTPFNLLERARSRHGDGSGPLPPELEAAYKAQYDPLLHIDGVVLDRKRAVYLLGNPADKTTPYENQQLFVDALQRAGHRAVLEPRTAKDNKHHAISYAESIKQAKMCLQTTN